MAFLMTKIQWYLLGCCCLIIYMEPQINICSGFYQNYKHWAFLNLVRCGRRGFSYGMLVFWCRLWSQQHCEELGENTNFNCERKKNGKWGTHYDSHAELNLTLLCSIMTYNRTKMFDCMSIRMSHFPEGFWKREAFQLLIYILCC